MIEAYKIGTTFTIKGDARQQLNQIGQAAKKAGKDVKEITGFFTMFNKAVLLTGKSFDEITPLVTRFSNKAMLGIENVGDSFADLNRRISSTIGKTDMLIQRTEVLRRTYGRSIGGRIGISGGGSGGGGGHGGGFGMHSHGFSMGGFGFGGAGLALGAALTAGYAMHSVYETGKDYDRSFTQYKLMGLGNAANNAANQQARNVRMPGISSIDMVDAITDATMATRSVGEGRVLATPLAMAAVANKINYGDKWSRKQEQDLIKFAEMRGGSDPKAILRELTLAQKMVSASGGRVLPSDLLLFIKQAQTGGFHLTDDALYKLEPSLQEMGGQKLGTGFQTGFNQLITGKGMSTAEAIDLSKMGMLDPARVIYDPLHRRLLNKPGALKAKYAHDMQYAPTDFFFNDYLPLLAKRGINSEDDIIKQTAYDFGRTYAGDASNWLKNKNKIALSAKMNPLAHGIQSSYQDAMGQRAGKEAQLSAATTQLKMALDVMTSPAVLGGMSLLTAFIKTTTFALGGVKPLFKDLWQPILDIPKLFNTDGRLNDYLAQHRHVEQKQPVNLHVYLDGHHMGSGFLDSITNSSSLTINSMASGHNAAASPSPVMTL